MYINPINETMLSLLLLGCQGSGKTTLARRIFQGCYETERDKDLVEYSTNIHNTLVSIVRPNFDRLSLGQKLARKTVPVVIVTIPRDQESTEPSQKWVQMAREFCPGAKVALAVTKNDLNPNKRRSSSDYTLQEHLFDGVVYDAMQVAEGVDRLFYTSNTTGQGMTGIKAWVQDTTLAHRTGNDYSSFGGLNVVKGKKNRFRKKNRGGCSVDGCDSCTLQ